MQLKAQLQRKCACGGSCGPCADKRKKPLDRAATDASRQTGIPPIVHDVLHGTGQPLDADTRRRMETSFNHDFTRVRVHTDPHAAASAQVVHARAYAVGNDIVFGRGAYNPRSADGAHLIAHELAHVVQQQQGISRSADTISSPHDPSEREADRAADLAVAGSPVGSLGRASSVLHRACPPVPTHLGDTAPATPCLTPSSTRGGVTIAFCHDSDEPLPGQEAAIAAAVPMLAPLHHVEIHGFASIEGPAGNAAEYNLNLSCHRARKVAALLVAHGVSAGKIRTFAHGGTTEFSKSREPNRIVTIGLPLGQNTPAPNRLRIAALSFLACAPCNPFTDDGTLALSPPASEPPVGSSYRMKHWIEAWVHSLDGKTIDSSAVVDKGAVAGESGYCGKTSKATVVARLGPVGGGISDPVHGEGMVWQSTLVTRVNADVPPTLPDAPCGPLGKNPKIPAISNTFQIKLFADGTKEARFLGASTYPFHYLYENGALKTHGGSPVRPAVDFSAWATSTGVSEKIAKVGFKALGRACCHGGTSLRGCPAKCGADGFTKTLPDPPMTPQPGTNILACVGAAAAVAMYSCGSSGITCASAAADCSPPTLPANP